MATLRAARSAILTLSLLLTGPSLASAAGIIYTGQTVDLHGTGFGNVSTLLVLHNSPAELGSVERIGFADVRKGDATAQSNIETAATVQGITGFNPASGFNEFALIFNIAEPGSEPDVTLYDFTLRFTDVVGNLLFDANYLAPPGGLTLTQVFPGVGGAGHLFLVQLTSPEAAQFFASPTNRLGQLVSEISQTGGAPESFFIQRSSPGTTENPPPETPPLSSPIPEPASLLLWGALAGIGIVGWRVRRS